MSTRVMNGARYHGASTTTTGGGGGAAAAALTVAATMLNTIALKESHYKEGIKVNHIMTKGAAERIRGLETLLGLAATAATDKEGDGGGGDDSATNDAMIQALADAKVAVRAIAEQNVERERSVDLFIRAVRSVQASTTTNAATTTPPPPNDATPTPTTTNSVFMEYPQAIEQAIMQEKQKRSSSLMPLEVHQELLYREVAQALGDPVVSVPKPKKRHSGGNRHQDDDDDDDIVVTTDTPLTTMAAGGGGTAAAAVADLGLKCPIAAVYMHDAVRNTVCHHVYSRVGIARHIALTARQSYGRSQPYQCKCPTAGCSNRSVTLAQCEDDVETQMRVKRQIRRQDAMQQQQQQLANTADTLLEDSDDDHHPVNH